MCRHGCRHGRRPGFDRTHPSRKLTAEPLSQTFVCDGAGLLTRSNADLTFRDLKVIVSRMSALSSMRPYVAASAALLALTTLAHADTYQFVFAGEDDEACSLPDAMCTPQNISFQLTSTPDSYNATSSTYNVTPMQNEIDELSETQMITASQTPASAQTLSFSYLQYPEEPESAFLLGQMVVNGGAFIAGPTSAPMYIPGSYTGFVSFYDYGLYGGPLTITDLNSPPSTVTPEPSTLALLGTGVLGSIGLLRRRNLDR